MDLALRASLVNFALVAASASTDDAFELVARIEAEQGAPTDVDSLCRFMAAIDQVAAGFPVG